MANDAARDERSEYECQMDRNVREVQVARDALVNPALAREVNQPKKTGPKVFSCLLLFQFISIL